MIYSVYSYAKVSLFIVKREKIYLFLTFFVFYLLVCNLDLAKSVDYSCTNFRQHQSPLVLRRVSLRPSSEARSMSRGASEE